MATLPVSKKVNPIAMALYGLGILVIVVGLINSMILFFLPAKFIWFNIDLLASNTVKLLYSLAISFTGILIGFIFIGLGELVRLLSISNEKG